MVGWTVRWFRRGAAALLTTLLLGFACTNAGAERGPGDLREIERRTFDAVNDYRQSRGLKALKRSSTITSAARGHSEAMASGAVPFGHDGFESRVSESSLKLQVLSAAENISKHKRDAAEIPEAAVEKWLGSAVHRKNIEGDRQLSGLGAARAPDGTVYLTQIFVGTG